MGIRARGDRIGGVEAEADVREHLGATEVQPGLPRLHAGARHVHVGAEETRRGEVADDGPDRRLRALERLIGNVEAALDSGEEAERSNGEGLALLRLRDARHDLVPVDLETEAVDLLHALIAPLELRVGVRDRLVELTEDVVRDVLHVAREHQAEVGPADVHADLLPLLLEVPFADARAALRGLLHRLDLAEGIERDRSADAEAEGGLPAGAEALVEQRVRRGVVERRAADRREVAEVRAEGPVREGRPARLVDLCTDEREASPRGPELRRVPLGQEQALLEGVGVRLDRDDGRRRQRVLRSRGVGRLRRFVVVEIERAGMRRGGRESKCARAAEKNPPASAAHSHPAAATLPNSR